MQTNITFEEFLSSVPKENQEFIEALHHELLHHGCVIVIKQAKSGYMVAYLYEKKTVVNYVFRKKGMLVRLYGVHVKEYETMLDSLPSEMVKSIENAPICKRLVNPDTCNPKCSMGYEFVMNQKPYQKCRNGAFMFPLTMKYQPYIQSLLLAEVTAYERS